MPNCNLFIGRTGCGKTSLHNLLKGEDPEPFSSSTKEAKGLNIDIDGRSHLFVDTVGFLDHVMSDTPQSMVNKLGEFLKDRHLEVGRVFYCTPYNERLLQEEIEWLALILHMLGGESVLQILVVVLTKVDAGFAKKRLDKNFYDNDLVKMVRIAFSRCPIVTSGYDNIDSVKKWLSPMDESPVGTVKPLNIQSISPDEDSQFPPCLDELRAALAKIQEDSTFKDQQDMEIAQLELQLDDISEIIENVWWNPVRSLKVAQLQLEHCKHIIRDLKVNDRGNEKALVIFKCNKLELMKEMEDLQSKTPSKETIRGAMFLMICLVGFSQIFLLIAQRER